MRNVIAAIALSSLAACASTPSTYSAPSANDPRVASSRPLTTTERSEVPAGGGFRSPDMQRLDGVSGLIGARAEQLTASFGDARIDLSEGDARKLQFASDTCVLDVFLYPLEPGQTPVATHVEARSPLGGSEYDRTRCIDQLNRR